MGDHNISAQHDERQSQLFMKALLNDVAALERMLADNLIETGVRRIGAEQELFLVDQAMRPSPIGPDVLATFADERLTTEIGRFNLEANLAPRVFTGTCLSELEQELCELLNKVRSHAQKSGADILLTGILPTIQPSDLTLENLTPNPRYFELNDTITRMRGNAFHIHIKGLDELQFLHDNVLLEACCTSFQIHLQVAPTEFATLYNLAQAITAPLLAIAANSPLLLGHRLWHETRIALFQHSVDDRTNLRQWRGHPPRVDFGTAWVKNSVVEIFREQITRFRVMLMRHIEENSLTTLARGELPQLAALRLHNGTIWRWNRPCYGINDGVAHLRIENRVLPAGPSVLDEMANAAFFYGLMAALPQEYGDVSRALAFDDAKDNFFAAARHGLKSQFTWLHGNNVSASDLILDHLLPLARQGLRHAGIELADRNRYLDIIEDRVTREQNGSVWALRSYAGLAGHGKPEQRLRALTAEMLVNQARNLPVHCWPLAHEVPPPAPDWQLNYRTVGQFMATDLFTVRPDDLVDLVACVMDWKHVRHVPVEDDDGNLLGLVSHRDLLKLISQGRTTTDSAPVAVRDMMTPNPITVAPDTPTTEAIALMRTHKIGCLPVIENQKLVGIITAYDFLALASDLLTASFQSSHLDRLDR